MASTEKERLLETLRALDTRRVTAYDELLEIAQQYNVKAQIYRAGIPLRTIDKDVYRAIRIEASKEVFNNGGGTIDELCKTIEKLISSGRCGLGKRTYIPSRRGLGRIR